MSWLPLVSSLTFAALRSGHALRMSDSTPQCLQKDRVKDSIAAVLSTTSQSSARPGCPPVHFIDPPRGRDDLGTMLNHLGLDGIGVEVGVQQGVYTTTLLEKWQKAKLYIQVDLWQHQEHYEDNANFDDVVFDYQRGRSCSEGQIQKQKGHVREIVQCKDYSTECAKLLPNSSIDFIYIDARHDRKGVLEDLQYYWPKVKVGGVIAGHDYVEQFEIPDAQDWTINGDGSRDESGRVVRGAVNDFFAGASADSPNELRECPRQPVITYREQNFNTWIVRK